MKLVCIATGLVGGSKAWCEIKGGFWFLCAEMFLFPLIFLLVYIKQLNSPTAAENSTKAVIKESLFSYCDKGCMLFLGRVSETVFF